MIKGFNYTAYDQDTGLFVRAKIYDITTGTPSFIANVDLTHLIAGSYNGVYNFDLDKTYAVVLIVYTDGTYTTIDTDRAPGTAIIEPLLGGQAEFPVSIQSQISDDGSLDAGIDDSATLEGFVLDDDSISGEIGS